MDYSFDSGMTTANAAQRDWFAQSPVYPNYGNVQAGQAYAQPVTSRVADDGLRQSIAAQRQYFANNPVTPNVLGAPKPAQDPMLAANAALRARYAQNAVTANASPQTNMLGHIGNALTKIFGSF